MLCYVAHAYGDSEDNYERAERITHDLQVNDTENCYICPLMVFSHLGYDERYHMMCQWTCALIFCPYVTS